MNVKQAVADEEHVGLEKHSLVNKMLKVPFKHQYIIVKVINNTWCNYHKHRRPQWRRLNASHTGSGLALFHQEKTDYL